MNVEQLMFAGAVLLGATAAAVSFARRLNLGSIVALLAVGMALGPHSKWPLIEGHVAEMQEVGEIGVTLLLFVVGLEIQPARLWSMRRLVLGLGAAQYGLTVVSIGALLLLLTGMHWQVVLVTSLALAMSSDAIALPILQERRDGGAPYGRATIAVGVFQSLMMIPALTVIPVLSGGPAQGGHAAELVKLIEVLVAVGVVFALGRFVIPRALSLTARDPGSGAFTCVVLAGVASAASIMESVGVSMALGAFMIGVLLSTTVFAEQIKAVAAPARQALLALFFIAIGMAIDLKEVGALGYDLLLYLPLLLAVKFLVMFGLALAFRMNLQAALLAGLLLMPFDEIGYVILANAKANGLLGARAHAIGLAVISLSFIVSPPLIALGYAAVERMRRKAGLAEAQRSAADVPPDEVVVIGYGYAGRAICTMLQRAEIPYVAFTDDLQLLPEAARRGHHVRYGDFTEPAMMQAISIGSARAVVMASGDQASTLDTIGSLRRFYPDVPVMAAVSSVTQRNEARERGARLVFPLSTEGTLSFGHAVLESLGVGDQQVNSIVNALRANDYAALSGIALER